MEGRCLNGAFRSAETLDVLEPGDLRLGQVVIIELQ